MSLGKLKFFPILFFAYFIIVELLLFIPFHMRPSFLGDGLNFLVKYRVAHYATLFSTKEYYQNHLGTFCLEFQTLHEKEWNSDIKYIDKNVCEDNLLFRPEVSFWQGSIRSLPRLALAQENIENFTDWEKVFKNQRWKNFKPFSYYGKMYGPELNFDRATFENYKTIAGLKCSQEKAKKVRLLLSYSYLDQHTKKMKNRERELFYQYDCLTNRMDKGAWRE